MPKPGEFYKHFKNKLYQIITIATHSETRETLVIYQALYGDFKTYARPIEMFVSEVDRFKYPEVEQKYRFELINFEDMKQDNRVNQVELNQEKLIQEDQNQEGQNQEYQNQEGQNQDDLNQIDEVESLNSTFNEEGEINPILLEFLDANSYEEKLSILLSKKKHIDDKLLNDMAVSLDCTVEEGPIEERINGLLFCLQTLTRFESNRLR